VVHCSERQNYFCTFYVNLDDMNVSWLYFWLIFIILILRLKINILL
jgi:hypothetical protein